MTVLHSALTGAELHEPKGVDAATANQLYLADGAASGAWTDVINVLTGAGLYETGTWTPSLTFVTPGDLSITYSNQSGFYIRLLGLVVAPFRVATSSFTHTTASGNLRILDMPFTVATTNIFRCPIQWRGITKANYTDYIVTPRVDNTDASLVASGSAQNFSSVTATDVPTAGTVDLSGTLIYYTED